MERLDLDTIQEVKHAVEYYENLTGEVIAWV